MRFELPSVGRQRWRQGGTVREVEQTEASKGYEVLFPVAVGAVFLVVLVVGALVG